MPYPFQGDLLTRHRGGWVALVGVLSVLGVAAALAAPPRPVVQLAPRPGEIVPPSWNALGWWLPQAGDGRTLRVVAITDDGMPVAVDGLRARIHLECAATIDPMSEGGAVLSGGGTSDAEILLEDGEARLRVIGASPGCVAVTLALGVESTREVRAPAPGAEPSAEPFGAAGAVSQPPLPDPGLPGTPHAPFVLPFAPYDVAIDPLRPYLYASDRDGKKVVFLNVVTGLVEREFPLAWKPEALTITPDGGRLWAALVVRDHSPYWWDSHEGYLVSWNLLTGVMDIQAHITEDPWDLVVTTDGRAVVSSGSGQWTDLKMFIAQTGQQIGVVNFVRERQNLSLFPGAARVYGIDTASFPGHLHRYDLATPAGAISYAWDAPYHGDHRIEGSVWSGANGLLVTGGGDVFRAGDTRATDMQFVQSLSTGPTTSAAFDSGRPFVFLAESDALRYYNTSSLVPVGSLPGAAGGNWVGVQSSRVVLVRRVGSTGPVTVLPHPAPDAMDDHPPHAVLSVTNAADVTTRVAARFDASASTDPDDAASALAFRWDFDADGTWDTGFDAGPVVTRSYPIAGTKRVRVQVRDPIGFVDEALVAVDVTHEAAPGDPPGAPWPFELPFPASAVVFDPRAPRAFAASATGNEVAVVSLTTGAIVTTFNVHHPPTALAIAADGSELYVGLSPTPAELDANGDQDFGWLVAFDLARNAIDRELPIQDSPYGMTATPAGQIVMSSGYRYHGGFRVYSVSDGTLLGEGYSWQGLRVAAVDPTGARIYVDNDPYLDSIDRYDLDPAGGLQYRWHWLVYGSGYPTDDTLWVTPDGSTILAGSGQAFRTGTTRTSDMVVRQPFSNSIGFRQMTFDPARRVFAAARTTFTSVLSFFNLDDLAEIASVPLTGAPVALGFSGDLVYVFTPQGAKTEVRTLAHPAPGGAGNTRPTARLSVGPAGRITTAVDIRLDASSSSDAETPSSALRFRWDLDDDGAWDGPWSAQPVTVKRWTTRGSRFVSVQVADAYGLTDTLRVKVDVAYEPAAGGPVDRNPAFEIPWMVNAVEFDRAHGLILATTASPRALVVVDAATGMVRSQSRLDKEPIAVHLDPDGTHVWVGQKGWEPDGYYDVYRDGPAGRLTELDVASGAVVRSFGADNVPEDFALLPDGRIVLPGWFTPTGILDPIDGHALGSGPPIYPGSRIVAHPSGERVYAADGYSITRLDLTAGGDLVETAHPMNTYWEAAWMLHMTPDGTAIFTGNTIRLALSDDPAMDLVPDEAIAFAYRSLGFDAPRHTIVAGTDGSMVFVNLESLLDFKVVPTGFSIEWAALLGEKAYGVALGSPTTVIVADHPGLQGEGNRPPVVVFNVSPSAPRTTLQDFVLDASSTTDDRTSSADLRFRFDFDGDGTWDTAFAAASSIAMHWDLGGTKRVRVQARDDLGAATLAEVVLDVAFVPDPGRVPSGLGPWQVPFEAADALGDPKRPFVYLADFDGRRIVVMDIRTGIALREFRFQNHPRFLALSPDGDRLFATVSRRASVSPSYLSAPPGEIASIDLTVMTKDRQFALDIDPWGLVVRPHDQLVVARIAGPPFGYFSVYDGYDGSHVGDSAGWNGFGRMTLDPSGSFMYVTGDLLSPGFVERWEFGADGIPWQRWYLSSRYGFDQGRIWFAPAGDRVLSGFGTLHLSIASPFYDLQQISQPLGFTFDVIWPGDRPELVTLEASGAFLRRGDDLSVVRSYPGKTGEYLSWAGRYLVAVDVEYGLHRTTLRPFEANHAPTAFATSEGYFECDGDRIGPVVLDGSGSWDPDAIGGYDDDLASFAWIENGVAVATGAQAAPKLGLGPHVITLRVTDRSGESSEGSVYALVVDSQPPSGHVVAPAVGACFGPAGVPVVVVDDFADVCDPDLARAYQPAGGPSYTTHGDRTVQVTATDASGFSAAGATSFTIDLVPPTIRIDLPLDHTTIPSDVPLSVSLSSADDDGAAGGVVHERLFLGECLLYDGATWGDLDGLLHDETIRLDDATLCRAKALCGRDTWTDPTITADATDCGGNVGSAATRLRGTLKVKPERCP